MTGAFFYSVDIMNSPYHKNNMNSPYLHRSPSDEMESPAYTSPMRRRHRGAAMTSTMLPGPPLMMDQDADTESRIRMNIGFDTTEDGASDDSEGMESGLPRPIDTPTTKGSNESFSPPRSARSSRSSPPVVAGSSLATNINRKISESGHKRASSLSSVRFVFKNRAWNSSATPNEGARCCWCRLAFVMLGTLFVAGLSKNLSLVQHHDPTGTRLEQNIPSLVDGGGGSSANGPNQYIIGMAWKRASEFRKAANERSKENELQNRRTLVKGHPAFQNVSRQFQPTSDWRESHFPHISVVGLPKAGTSQLYNILTSHPQLQSFHVHKEFCFNLPTSKKSMDTYKLQPKTEAAREEVQRIFYKANYQKPGKSVYPIQDWTLLLSESVATRRSLISSDQNMTATMTSDTTLSTRASSARMPRTVNGCHDTPNVFMQMQYLFGSDLQHLNKHQGPIKVIFMLRDPADWLWSAWNFWSNKKGHEDNFAPVQNDWASAPLQFRSPELFHEYMLAGDRLKASVRLLDEYRSRVALLSSQLVVEAKRNADIDVLVLKTEDMTPQGMAKSGFLERVASFVGVDKDGFDESILQSFSNCGDFKGPDTSCQNASTAYEISGFRGMLEETRELVYLHFAEECKLWAEELGIVYSDCRAIRKKYNLDRL